MTAEQWGVVGTLAAIILFLSTGIGFSYNGLKRWKSAPAGSRDAIDGKREFYLGIGLFIMLFASILLCIYLVKNGIIVEDAEPQKDPPNKTGEDIIEEEPKEKPNEEPHRFYVSNQLYHGAYYSGYVNESRHPDGKGTMQYKDGSEYTGEWVDGVRQGQGVMKYDNGTYNGEWQNDKKNGQGVYTWEDGKKYEGAYENDVRSGNGVFSGWVDLTNGYTGTYWGESKNDHFEGSGRFLFDNGDVFEGVYKEDLYWTGVYTRKDGSSYEVVNGQPQ